MRMPTEEENQMRKEQNFKANQRAEERMTNRKHWEL